VAQGVMLAILKLNISVPQALRLILHRSKASEVLCPIACSCVLNDDREVAEGMLKTIEDLFANKKPTATKQTWSVREASSWVPPLVIDTP
jgi:DNA-binding LacI/PurR family transcriptional regulator